MHHPDICDIILIIDDYFLLSAAINAKCQVEAIVDDSDEHEPKRGIRISRKLYVGYIQADIWEMNEDDDTVTFSYCRETDSGKWIDSTEIESCDYSEESVRSVVRKIIKKDKELAVG
jgi:hypothetical protein